MYSVKYIISTNIRVRTDAQIVVAVRRIVVVTVRYAIIRRIVVVIAATLHTVVRAVAF